MRAPSTTPATKAHARRPWRDRKKQTGGFDEEVRSYRYGSGSPDDDDRSGFGGDQVVRLPGPWPGRPAEHLLDPGGPRSCCRHELLCDLRGPRGRNGRTGHDQRQQRPGRVRHGRPGLQRRRSDGRLHQLLRHVTGVPGAVHGSARHRRDHRVPALAAWSGQRRVRGQPLTVRRCRDPGKRHRDLELRRGLGRQGGITSALPASWHSSSQHTHETRKRWQR